MGDSASWVGEESPDSKDTFLLTLEGFVSVSAIGFRNTNEKCRWFIPFSSVYFFLCNFHRPITEVGEFYCTRFIDIGREWTL